MRNIKKRIIRIAIILSSVFLLFAGLSFILGIIFKEEIKNHVVNEINKEINVKVQVRTIDLSALRKFPFMSLVLNDVIVWSSGDFEKEQFNRTDADTLFAASKIFLQLNLFDIIKQDYRIKKIHALNGKLNLLTDRYGLKNYLIFKQKSNPSEEVSIALDGLKISGFTWNYINLSEKVFAKGQLTDVNLKGQFASSSFSLTTAGDFSIEDFSSKNASFTRNLIVGIKMNMDVHDSVYTINSGELRLNDIDFNITGSITSEQFTVLGIQLKADGLDLVSFFSSIPLEIKSMNNFKPSGKLDITANISGKTGRNAVPGINASFTLTNGKLIVLKPERFRLEGISLKGTFSNGPRHNLYSSSVKLNEYEFTNGKNHLKGSLYIMNFSDPDIKAVLNGTFEARLLSGIIVVPGFKFDDGVIHPDLTIHTVLSGNRKFERDNIVSSGIYGNAQVENVSGTLPGVKEYIKTINGEIRFDDDTWFPKLNARTENSDLQMEIEADHVLGYFLYKKSSLWLKGEIKSGYLDLKKFIPGNSSDSVESVFPKKLYMKLSYTAEGMEYGKFHADKLASGIDYKPGILVLSGLNFNSMKGRINTDAIVSEKPDGKIMLSGNCNLEKIDINKLFYTFNNFAQKFIIDDNLRGLISGKLESSIILDQRFQPDFSTLAATSDIVITNGELVNFEPIRDLSRFVELSELEHIRFSTLQNSILIKESKVYIPQMDINSSAFNITTSGTHRFDNYFEYKLKVQLYQLLAKKMKDKKRDEFGIIENDNQGANIFLSINGTPEDYKIKYDRKEAVNKIRTDLQKEKTVIKAILNDELGLFKGQGPAIKNKTEEKEQIIFEWEDEDKTSPIIQKQSKKSKSDTEFEFTLD